MLHLLECLDLSRIPTYADFSFHFAKIRNPERINERGFFFRLRTD